MPLSYPQTIEFLYGLQRHGIKLGLDTIRALLDRSGSPERAYPVVHITGTNGKGSTAAMVASMLDAAGYRVGLYTSPHLIDFRERIQVGKAPIPELGVAAWTERLREAAGDTLVPTFFEFTTAMAFHHFAAEGVDVAVLEVGMGGRFDATNVVRPVVTAITNVARDHEQHLGHDLASIAFEKAGIIKPGVPLVVGRLCEAARAVIRPLAEDRGAPYHALGEAFAYTSEGRQAFSYSGRRGRLEGLICPLAGAHQMDNAACALAVLDLLAEADLRVPEPALRSGLAGARWEGRLEIAEDRPTLLLDGAHNPAAAEVLARYLADCRRERAAARVLMVLGMMRDKDHGPFLDALVPLVDEFILTEPGVARAASVRELAARLQERGRGAELRPLPADALAEARRRASADDLICVTGSLMLVGDIKALLRGCGLSSIRG